MRPALTGPICRCKSNAREETRERTRASHLQRRHLPHLQRRGHTFDFLPRRDGVTPLRRQRRGREHLRRDGQRRGHTFDFLAQPWQERTYGAGLAERREPQRRGHTFGSGRAETGSHLRFPRETSETRSDLRFSPATGAGRSKSHPTETGSHLRFLGEPQRRGHTFASRERPESHTGQRRGHTFDFLAQPWQEDQRSDPTSHGEPASSQCGRASDDLGAVGSHLRSSGNASSGVTPSFFLRHRVGSRFRVFFAFLR